MVEWEQQHFDALKTLHAAVGADFGDKSGFSPLV
jgi:hypothetical protein